MANYDSGMPPMKKPHLFGIQVRLEKRERSGKSDETGEKE